MSLPWTHLTNDIDAIYPADGAWEFELVQLEGGSLGYRAVEVALPGLRLSSERHDRPVRSNHLKITPSLYFGAAVSPSGWHSWKGQDVSYGQILNFGNEEQDILSLGGALTLNFEIDPSAAAEFGLTHLPPGVWDCDLNRFEDLLGDCLHVLSTWGRQEDLATASPAALHSAATTILSKLAASLSRLSPLTPHNRYETLRRAEEHLNAFGWDNALAVEELSDTLGVSRRTLHRAFDEILGMGPASYIRLVRLHNFHRSLKSPKRQTSVTEAALDAGFEHFGRAARYHRAHFGTLPKEVSRALAAE